MVTSSISLMELVGLSEWTHKFCGKQEDKCITFLWYCDCVDQAGSIFLQSWLSLLIISLSLSDNDFRLRSNTGIKLACNIKLNITLGIFCSLWQQNKLYFHSFNTHKLSPASVWALSWCFQHLEHTNEELNSLLC